MPDRITYFENPLDPAKLIAAFQAGQKLRQQREAIEQQAYERELGKWQTGLQMAKAQAEAGAPSAVDFASIFGAGATPPDAVAEPLPLPAPRTPALPFADVPFGPDDSFVAPAATAAPAAPAPAPTQTFAPPPVPTLGAARPDLVAMLQQAFNPASTLTVPGSQTLGIPETPIPIYSRDQEMLQGLAKTLLQQRLTQDAAQEPLPGGLAELLGEAPGTRVNPSLIPAWAGMVNDRTLSPPTPDRTVPIDAFTAGQLGRVAGEEIPESVFEANVRMKGSQDAIRAAAAGRAESRAFQLERPLTPRERFRQEAQLAKEWAQVDSVDNKMQRTITIMRNAQQGGAGDEILVREFLLNVEPTSVVRESEHEAVRKLGGWYDSLASKFQRALKGGYFNAAMRKELLDASERIHQAVQFSRDYRRQEYERVAAEYGLNPRNIFRMSPKVPLEGSEGVAGSAAPGRAQYTWDPVAKRLVPAR